MGDSPNQRNSAELRQKIQTAIEQLQTFQQQLDENDENTAITDENLLALCVRFFGEMYGEYLDYLRAQLEASGNFEPPVKGPGSQLGDIRRDLDSREIYQIDQLESLYDQYRGDMQAQFRSAILASAQSDEVKNNLYTTGYLFPMYTLLGLLNRQNNQ